MMAKIFNNKHFALASLMIMTLMVLNPPAAEAAEKRKRIYSKDFMVTCRINDSCEAISFLLVQSSKGQAYHYLDFYRPPGVKTNSWWVQIGLIVNGIEPGTPLTIQTDKKTWQLQPGVDFVVSKANTITLLPPVGTELLHAARDGNIFIVSYGAESGEAIRYRPSIRGLKKALAWINRQKGVSNRNFQAIEPINFGD